MSQTLYQQLVHLRGQAEAWAAGERVFGFEALVGICSNLKLGEAGCTELNNLIARWPACTGYKDYPVPHPVKNPANAYIIAGAQEMWSPRYEYARNRWALLDWLIEQTTSEADQ